MVSPNLRKLLTALLTTYFRYVLGAAALLVLVVGYVYILQPQVAEVRTKGIASRQREQQRLENRQEYLVRVKDMVAKYEQSVQQTNVDPEKILPSEPAIGDLFLTLQQIASESGTAVEAIAVTKGTSLATGATSTTAAQPGTAAVTPTLRGGSSTVQILDVSVTLIGNINYVVYKKLLESFEQSKRLIDVARISFINQGQDAAASTAIFELQTYYLESTTRITSR